MNFNRLLGLITCNNDKQDNEIQITLYKHTTSIDPATQLKSLPLNKEILDQQNRVLASVRRTVGLKQLDLNFQKKSFPVFAEENHKVQFFIKFQKL